MTPQADWVKEKEQYQKMGAEIIRLANKFGIDHVDLTNELGTLVGLNREFAQQRTEKKWRERIDKIFQPFDLVIDCEPDCDPVTHARHDGSWKAHIKAEQMKADLLK